MNDAERDQMMGFDKNAAFEEKVKPLLSEAKKQCKFLGIPFVFACATRNYQKNGKQAAYGTQYVCDGVLTGSNGIRLFEDRFEDFLLVLHGAKLAPLADIEMDSIAQDYMDAPPEDGPDGPGVQPDGAGPAAIGGQALPQGTGAGAGAAPGLDGGGPADGADDGGDGKAHGPSPAGQGAAGASGQDAAQPGPDGAGPEDAKGDAAVHGHADPGRPAAPADDGAGVPAPAGSHAGMERAKKEAKEEAGKDDAQAQAKPKEPAAPIRDSSPGQPDGGREAKAKAGSAGSAGAVQWDAGATPKGAKAKGKEAKAPAGQPAGTKKKEATKKPQQPQQKAKAKPPAKPEPKKPAAKPKPDAAGGKGGGEKPAMPAAVGAGSQAKGAKDAKDEKGAKGTKDESCTKDAKGANGTGSAKPVGAAEEGGKEGGRAAGNGKPVTGNGEGIPGKAPAGAPSRSEPIILDRNLRYIGDL